MYANFTIIIGRNFGNIKILIPVIHERNFSFNFLHLKIFYCLENFLEWMFKKNNILVDPTIIIERNFGNI